MSPATQNHDWGHVAHGVHMLKHAMESEQGKAVMNKAAGAAVAVAAALPVLLPVLAIGAGVTAVLWWWKK